MTRVCRHRRMRTEESVTDGPRPPDRCLSQGCSGMKEPSVSYLNDSLNLYI